MAKDVIMPVLGMSQDSGVLLKWLKGEGDEVNKGDILMEVETDKAVVEIEAQASGTLANISAAEGEDVPTGQIIASILQAGESAADTQTSEPAAGTTDTSDAAEETSAPAQSTSAQSTSAQSTAESVSSTPAKRSHDTKVLASPKAKRLASERGIDLAEVLGTGPDAVIVADDVLGHVPTEQAAPAAATRTDAPTHAASVGGIAFDNVQADVDVTALLGYLERTQQHLADATLQHLLVRFCAVVLRKYPLGSEQETVNVAVYNLEQDTPTFITDAAKKSTADIVEYSVEYSSETAGEAAGETAGEVTFEVHDFTDSGVARATRHPHAPAKASLTLGHVTQNQLTLTLAYDGNLPTRDAAAFIRTLSQLIQQPDDLIFLF